MFKLYNSFLLKRPILTNSISAGILMTTGDYLAQKLFPQTPNQPFDYSRSMRSCIMGCFIFSPMCYKWYKFLGTKVGWKAPDKKLESTCLKVLVDQLIFVPFICYPVFYSSSAILENDKKPIWENMKDKFEMKWWDTVKTNWSVWPFVQFANFYLLPPHLRLLTINVFSLGWNTFLSYILNSNTIKE